MRGAPHAVCSLRVPSSAHRVQLRGAGAQPRGLQRRSPSPGPASLLGLSARWVAPEALWPGARAQGRPPPRACTPRAPARPPPPSLPAQPARPRLRVRLGAGKACAAWSSAGQNASVKGRKEVSGRERAGGKEGGREQSRGQADESALGFQLASAVTSESRNSAPRSEGLTREDRRQEHFWENARNRAWPPRRASVSPSETEPLAAPWVPAPDLLTGFSGLCSPRLRPSPKAQRTPASNCISPPECRLKGFHGWEHNKIQF